MNLAGRRNLLNRDQPVSKSERAAGGPGLGRDLFHLHVLDIPERQRRRVFLGPPHHERRGRQEHRIAVDVVANGAAVLVDEFRQRRAVGG